MVKQMEIASQLCQDALVREEVLAKILTKRPRYKRAISCMIHTAYYFMTYKTQVSSNCT